MKNWRIKFGIDYHYLTDKEVDFYLKTIGQGEEYVEVRKGMILSKNFIELIKLDIVGEEEKIESRKWQCENGTWHSKGATCFCTKDYVIADGVARLIKKTSI